MFKIRGKMFVKSDSKMLPPKDRVHVNNTDKSSFPKVFLVGFMSSGKSYLGRKLSCLVGLPFVDLDEYISDQQSLAIADLFSFHGEGYFRELEKNALGQLLRLQSAIISTGGGTPCFHDNMDLMRESGVVVYLKKSPEILLGRLSQEAGNRPLVAGKSIGQLAEYIQATLEWREPFYSRAHVVYEGDDVRGLFKELLVFQRSNAQGL